MSIGRVPGATGIQPSIVDAKGDLIVATAADSVSRLAVGANDLILVADSAQTTGLKWGGSWTSYTPTYSGITVGNGTVDARYIQIGKFVSVYYKLTWGTTTSVNAYGNFTLPVTGARSGFLNGNATFIDEGIAIYNGQIYQDTGTVVYFVANDASGTYSKFKEASGTVPVTFGNTDKWIAQFTYEAA